MASNCGVEVASKSVASKVASKRGFCVKAAAPDVPSDCGFQVASKSAASAASNMPPECGYQFLIVASKCGF